MDIGVNVGVVPIGAFLSLIRAGRVDHRKGDRPAARPYPQRPCLLVTAAIIFVLIVYRKRLGVLLVW